MSVAYTLFLEQRPRLAATALGGMALEVHRYTPQPGDPIAHEPWRASIAWVIEANGHITDDDAWRSFVARSCRRYRGRLWCAATGTLEDVDLDDAADEVDDARAEHRRDEAELATLTQMVADAERSPETMRRLKHEVLTSTIVFRIAFPALLVERAKRGAPLASWRWALPLLEIDRLRRIAALATPRSRIAFAKKGPLAAAIVARYEAALRRAAAREAKSQTTARIRDATKQHDQLVRWLAEPDVDPPLVEQRRRGGETLAGIPRSTTALLAEGKLAAAIADYARRYGVTSQVARKVVTPHAAPIREAFTVAKRR